MRRGFTLIELMVIIVIISVLAGLGLVAYGTWQQRTATTVVKADLAQASNLLKSVRNFKNTYPTSLFAEELSTDDKPSFKPSEEVTVLLRTNATTLPQYSGLTQAQNTQLFIDACNSAMPIVGSSGTTYHTSCYSFITGLLQVRLTSTGGRSAYISNPVQSNFTITCTKLLGSCNEADYAPAVTTAVNEMKQRFQNQGGTFPATMPLLFFGAVLPAPSSLYSFDDATAYCLEAVSKKYADLVYHKKTSTGEEVIDGTCPADSADF